MSIFEFDEEREWRLIREAEYRYGVEDGRVEGEFLLGNLITKLFAAGRADDVELAAKDEEVRKRLYKEFGISD